MRINLRIDEHIGVGEFLNSLDPKHRSYYLKLFTEIGYMVWSGDFSPDKAYQEIEDYFDKWLSRTIATGRFDAMLERHISENGGLISATPAEMPTRQASQIEVKSEMSTKNREESEEEQDMEPVALMSTFGDQDILDVAAG